MNSLTRVVRRFAAAVASGLVVAAVGLFAQTPAKTPTDAYLNYRAAILKVRSMDQLKPHLAQSAIKMMDSAPADQRAVMLDFIKEMSTAITNVKVIKENVTGDSATLEVTGTDVGDKSTKKATVDVVREAGVWKFAKESWGAR